MTYSNGWQVKKLHVLETILFVLTASLDNFTVALSYGVKKIRIGAASNLLIAGISAAGTLLSMTIGTLLSRIIPDSAANRIGSLILILIGISFLFDFFRHDFHSKHKNKKPYQAGSEAKARTQEKEPSASDNGIYKNKNGLIETYKNELTLLDSPEKADTDQSGTIDLKESFALGFALALNNFGMGIGASISGFNILFTTACTFACSIFMIILGCRIGSGVLSKITGKYSSLISALIILLIGIYEFLAG